MRREVLFWRSTGGGSPWGNEKIWRVRGKRWIKWGASGESTSNHHRIHISAFECCIQMFVVVRQVVCRLFCHIEGPKRSKSTEREREKERLKQFKVFFVLYIYFFFTKRNWNYFNHAWNMRKKWFLFHNCENKYKGIIILNKTYICFFAYVFYPFVLNISYFERKRKTTLQHCESKTNGYVKRILSRRVLVFTATYRIIFYFPVSASIITAQHSRVASEFKMAVLFLKKKNIYKTCWKYK